MAAKSTSCGVIITDGQRLLLGHATGSPRWVYRAGGNSEAPVVMAGGLAYLATDKGTVQALVASGMGAALVPRLTIDESDPAIAVVELGDRLPPRLIGIAWHRDRRPTRGAEGFVAAATSVCARFEPAAAA